MPETHIYLFAGPDRGACLTQKTDEGAVSRPAKRG